MGTNSGWYSKFQERLKKMVRNRLKRQKKGNQEELQEQFITEKVKEIREVMGKVDNSRRNPNVKNIHKRPILPKEEKTLNKDINKNEVNINLLKEKSPLSKPQLKINDDLKDIRESTNKITQPEVQKDNITEQKAEVKDSVQPEIKSKVNIDNKQKNISTANKFPYMPKNKKNLTNTNLPKEKVQKLGIEIINKLKENFNEKLDQLDILESELYLLSDKQNNILELKKIKELKEKIDNLVEELNNIINTYNLFERNYYIDYVIDLDDKYLADDIINYRTLLDNSKDEIDFVKEYKLLDEFKNLYNKLIIVKHDTEVLIENNEEKTNEFDIRDEKYKNIVNSIIKIDNIEKDCLYEIEKQNEYLEKLASKINDIDKHEYVTSHLRGVDNLISQTLKYIGLRMLSPLSGLIPSIAVNTLATRQLIGNIYRNLHYEDVRHVYYSTIDYDSELNNKIADVKFTENLIIDTLDDIKKLKEEFMKQYNSEIPGYQDTLKKINSIEKIIYRNQNKINKVKKKLIVNKKINEKKLVRVKTLNQSSYNNN